MEHKRRRELALASIALVVLAIAVWTQRAGGRPSNGGTPAGAAAGTPAQTGQKPPFAGVNLEALEAERPEPDEGTRNPFRFKQTPMTAPPPSTGVKPPPQPSVTAPVVAGPPGVQPPPRIMLKYIGDVADPLKAGAKIAVLTDGRNVFQGREGDVIEGRYRIERIGVESVDLAYLDGRGRQTIRQTGQ